MQQNEIIRQLLDTIDKSVTGFNKGIPGFQQNMVDEISMLLKDLEMKGGKVLGTASNLKLLLKIKGKIEGIVNSPE